MALIVCPECGKEFSERAAACPNCGCPNDFLQKKDEKEKIDNLIINAEREYSNKNYKQAYDIYGQVLIAEPNNSKALLYRGLSDGWTANLSDTKLDSTLSAVQEALNIAYEEQGCSDSFIEFTREAQSEYQNLCSALHSMAVNTVSKIMDNCVTQINNIVAEGRRASARTTTNAQLEAVKREGQNAIQRTKNDADEASLEYFGIMLDSNAHKDKLVHIVFDYLAKSPGADSEHFIAYCKDLLKARQTALKSYEKDLTETDGAYAECLKSIISSIRQTERKYDEIVPKKQEEWEAAREAIAQAYWRAHPDEAAELIKKRDELVNDTKALMEKTKAFAKEQADVAMKHATNRSKWDENEKIETLKNEIKSLSAAKQQLGMFKGKEKKALDAQISEKQHELQQFNKILEEKEKEDAEVIKQECGIIEEKIAEINNQITANIEKTQKINTLIKFGGSDE